MLEEWLDSRENNQSGPGWDNENPANLLVAPEWSWPLYQLAEISAWTVLPHEGGWLDQPDWFLHDAVIFSRRLAVLRENRKVRRRAHGKAQRFLGLKGRFRG